MRTTTQERALALRQNTSKHFHEQREIPNQVTAAQAFGMRLLDLMWVNRSREFKKQTTSLRDRAMKIFAADDLTDALNPVELAKLITEFHKRANIFEEQRMHKHANFTRAIHAAMQAVACAGEKNNFLISRNLSEAACKAFYAGADHEQIMAAFMLLF